MLWRGAASLCLLAGGAAQAEPYAWPLDTPRRLTSSFGEYRSGRCHAGIDLRASTGTPVRAADDGHVTRLRVSPWGYGKAVYLRLTDGNTVIYGHLDRFEEPIESFVRREQHARESYSVDLYPGEGAISVKRGDVIATTGSTGAGPPHLHWEIRDANNIVINPRTLGIDWPDDTRPVVEAVAVVPGSADARINGDAVPVILTPRYEGGGQYVCDAVAVSGSIGLAVVEHDPANEGANQLGIHTLEAQVDGETVFRMVNDRLSYDTMHHGSVCWHPYLAGSGRFLTAFRYPGNRAEPYGEWRGDGIFSLPGGSGEATLILTDFLGNEARVRIPLEASAELPEVETGVLSEAPAAGVDVWGGWLTLSLHYTAAQPHAPDIRLSGGRPLPVIPTAPNAFRVVVNAASPEPGEHVLTQATAAGDPLLVARMALHPRGVAQRIAIPGGAELAAGPDAAFGAMVLDLTQDPVRVTDAPVAPRGLAYAFGSPYGPIDQPVTVRLPYPDGVREPGRVHIYRQTGSGWSWQTTKRNGDWLEAETQRLGTFAVLEDDAAPSISHLEPAADAVLDTRRPVLRARVSDRGSGVAGVRMTLEGQWLLAAYDSDEETVFWERDHDLPSGMHTLTVTVTDRAGNAATTTRAVTVP